MGCHQCWQCGGKFEAYDAEEYAAEIGDYNSDSDEELKVDYDTCPGCLKKAKVQAEKDAYSKRQEAELVALRAEVASLRKKLAASNTIDLTNDSDTKQPATKKAKVSGKVWVIVKGDWPDTPHSQLVDIDVLGTYSSKEKAETAMEDFIEDGGWEQGYGYHRCESESNIQIIAKTIDDPAE